MPGLQAGSPVGGMQEATDQCLSHTSMFLSLSPFLPFSLKINKQNLFYIYLLIMLLQLSLFRPFIQLHLAHSLPPTFPPYSSCPWVILISSLASTFPTLFLPSPCLFSTYHLCYLFSVPSPLSPPPTPLMITLHVISISVIMFLF